MAIESKDLLVALKAFSRANPLPLDASEIYSSKEEAEAYLLKANAYPGQTIKVLENGRYISYTIQPNVDGLYLEPIGRISSEEEVEAGAVETKSLSEWTGDKDKVYPAGTLLVYTDRTYKNGVPVADIKIANGVSTVEALPFLNDSDVKSYLTENGVSFENGVIKATTFDGAMKHKLTIGDFQYDGSEDVSIPVYNGENL